MIVSMALIILAFSAAILLYIIFWRRTCIFCLNDAQHGTWSMPVCGKCWQERFGGNEQRYRQWVATIKIVRRGE